MSPNEKLYYEALGKRIAEYRKAQRLTQQQVADTLGISQKTIAHYEVGRLRIPVVMLPELARLLSISIETLVDEAAAKQLKNKRRSASKLERQLERIAQLPRTKQKFVMDMLDTVIQQQDVR